MYSAKVHAQTSDSVSAHVQKVEEITPTMTAGSIGGYLVLAHTMQSDEAVVGGLDLLKLHLNTLNYLSRQLGANQIELQNIVSNSRAEKVYTIKSPQPPQNPQPNTGKPKP
jgi:hypothetical protein